jgi:hypothetical protein
VLADLDLVLLMTVNSGLLRAEVLDEVVPKFARCAREIESPRPGRRHPGRRRLSTVDGLDRRRGGRERAGRRLRRVSRAEPRLRGRDLAALRAAAK